MAILPSLPAIDALYAPRPTGTRAGASAGLRLTSLADPVQLAVACAQRRWPALRDALDTAAALVAARAVFDLPDVLPTLALCRPAGARRGQLVALTDSGFRCTCPAWPPALRAGPGDGRYCPDILAMLLAVYLDRRDDSTHGQTGRQSWLSPLPHTPVTLWEQALDELRRRLPRATFDSWLAGSAVVAAASTPLHLTVAVRTSYAQEWLSRRLHGVVSRTLSDVAGHELSVDYVCAVVMQA